MYMYMYMCDSFLPLSSLPPLPSLPPSSSLQRDVHRAIVDKKSDGQLAGAEKPRAGKRGRWDMQQTPDVHAPPTKKSAWDEVS